ncbi:hypothetical protein CEUSTIGMA_g1291.t1 [Chlamydomonas eustigma]|uniref:Uncharacterized protein n=1 Tax=Chlamydomonas eustigma TaxID=1157962 RepID=A0A250WSR8_9CHLO|nr:hypothetical protein CEUSTIGMA_g1291.t1 [Chlamydomonas eustigma]|eukprot:GAX73841.1 hypothetical protein CEUSTIGMA_g1291.t1 [Chlamydomonas eustigma]
MQRNINNFVTNQKETDDSQQDPKIPSKSDRSNPRRCKTSPPKLLGMLSAVSAINACHKNSTGNSESNSKKSLHLRGVLKKTPATAFRFLQVKSVSGPSNPRVCLEDCSHTKSGSNIRTNAHYRSDCNVTRVKQNSSMLILGGPAQACKANAQSKPITREYFNHYDDGRGDWIPEQLGVESDDPCINEQWETRGVKGLGGKGN